jgi:hypothetical protein
VRLIHNRILKFQGKDTLNIDGWESGLTTEKIQEALNSWNADPLPDGYYRLTKTNADLQLILDAYGIIYNLRLPKSTNLK